MLDLALNPAIADLICDHADARTQLRLRRQRSNSKRDPNHYLDLLLEVEDKEKLEETVQQAFGREYFPLARAVMTKYDSLRELGIDFSDEQVQRMGDIAVNYQTNAGAKLFQRYLSNLNGNKAKSLVQILDILYSSKAEDDIPSLGTLDDHLLVRGLRETFRKNYFFSDRLVKLASLIKKRELLDEMVAEELGKENDEDRLNRFIELAGITGNFSAIENYAETEHADNIARQLEVLMMVYKENRDPQVKDKVENLAYRIIAENNLNREDGPMALKKMSGIMKLDHQRVLEETDKRAREALARWEEKDLVLVGDYATNDFIPLKTLCSYYGWGGNLDPLGPKGALRRLGDLATEIGALGQAEQFYASIEHGEGLYQLGKLHAEAGKQSKAFECFKKANLQRVNTNERLFYETITKGILPALIQGIDPEAVKEAVNTQIKPHLIRGIQVSERGCEIEFGSGNYTLAIKHNQSPSRNDIQDYAHGFVETETVKRYKTEKNFKAEKFWLQVLDGKVPIKRMLASNDRERKIQVETSHGVPLLELFEDIVGSNYTLWTGKSSLEMDKVVQDRRFRSYLGSANRIAQELYATINEKDLRPELERLGIPYKLDAEYIDERFVKFLRHIEDSELRRKVTNAQRKVTDCLVGNVKGLIHNDYSPRNLMAEDGNVVVIDHENYREGHPLMQIISLWTFPMVQYNGTPAEHWVKHIGGDDELIDSGIMFWSMRQANATAGKSHLQPYYDFFIERVAEKLEKKSRLSPYVDLLTDVVGLVGEVMK